MSRTCSACSRRTGAVTHILLVLLVAVLGATHAAPTLSPECLSAGKTRVASVAECLPSESCTVCALVDDVAACGAHMVCRARLVASANATAGRDIKIEEQWIVVEVASSTSSGSSVRASAEELQQILATGHLTIDGWSRVNEKPSRVLALPDALVAGFGSLSVLKLRNVSLQSLQLPALERIRTLGDGLTSLDAVLTRSVLGPATALHSLALHHNLLTEVPVRVFELAALRTLRLQHNAITRQRLTPAQFAFLSTTLTALEVDTDAFERTGCAHTVAFASNASVSTCDPMLAGGGGTSSSSSAAQSQTKGDRSEREASGAWAAWLISLGAFFVIAAAVACGLAKKETLKRLLFGPSGTRARSDPVQQQSDAACYRAFQESLSDSSRLSLDEQLFDAWRRDPRLIVLTRPLGSKGRQSRTWLGTYRHDDVVVKTLPDSASARDRAVFVLNVRSTARFSHPNIVRFRGIAWRKGAGMQALLEYMDRGDLQSYLALSRTGAPSARTWWGTRQLEIALDVAQALLYLHTMKRASHCALTSRSVLLNHEFSAKVAHFAASRPLHEYGAAPASPATRAVDVSVVPRASAECERWTAPEVLCSASSSAGATLSEAVDIYAFGVILSELDTLEHPFERVQREQKLSDAQLRELLAAGSLKPWISPSCPAAAQELLLACLAHDPCERPTAAVVVQTLRELVSEIHRASSIAGSQLLPTTESAIGESAPHASSKDA